MPVMRWTVLTSNKTIKYRRCFFAPVFFCMCMLNVWGLFKADDESPTNLHMEALLHSEEAPPPPPQVRGFLPDFTCHYPGAASNSWFYGLWTAGMPNSVLKLPWLMSLQAVRTYFFKIFRWPFSSQPQTVLLPMLSRVTAPGKWLKIGQEVGVLSKNTNIVSCFVSSCLPAGSCRRPEPRRYLSQHSLRQRFGKNSLQRRSILTEEQFIYLKRCE